MFLIGFPSLWQFNLTMANHHLTTGIGAPFAIGVKLENGKPIASTSAIFWWCSDAVFTSPSHIPELVQICPKHFMANYLKHKWGWGWAFFCDPWTYPTCGSILDRSQPLVEQPTIVSDAARNRFLCRIQRPRGRRWRISCRLADFEGRVFFHRWVDRCLGLVPA